MSIRRFSNLGISWDCLITGKECCTRASNRSLVGLMRDDSKSCDYSDYADHDRVFDWCEKIFGKVLKKYVVHGFVRDNFEMCRMYIREFSLFYFTLLQALGNQCHALFSFFKKSSNYRNYSN